MPGMTGIELAAEIMQIRPGQPVILCTGYSAALNQEQHQATGIRAYLQKPISMEELSLRVREVLEAGQDRASA